MPAHRLPLFGKWLYDDLSAGTNLAAADSTARFAWMVKKVMGCTPRAPGGFGAHSMRRGSAMSMHFNQVDTEVITMALRHSSAVSTKPYLGEAAKMDTLANTQRAVARGGRHSSVPAGGPNYAAVVATGPGRDVMRSAPHGSPRSTWSTR